MKKKLLYIGLGILAVVVVFIGYQYVRYLKATSRMKELSADLERRITEWEKKEYKRPPLYGDPVAGNAAEFYRQAENIVNDQRDICILIRDAISNPTRPFSSDVQAYYEHNKHITGIVQNGVNAVTYKSLLGVRKGFSAWSDVPNLMTAMLMANTMILKARELESDNQFSEAMKTYAGILRMGDDYIRQGTLISGMTGVAVLEIGEEELCRMISQHKLSELHLNELIIYLRILLDTKPSILESWDVERLCVEFGLKRESEKSGVLFGDDFWGGEQSRVGLLGILTKKIKGCLWFNRAAIVEIWNDYITFYPEIQKRNTLPYQQWNDEAEFKKKVAALKNPISRVMVNNTGCIAYLYEQSYRRGVYILLVLELYRIKHQKYPDNLNALMPEIVQEVPLDPFTDKPFIYKIDGDNIYLYSVGPDLKDDGGDEKGGKDIVITVPPKK